MSATTTKAKSRDVIRYTSCGFHCFDQCVLKVRVRDGRLVSVEPDDTFNPGMIKDGEHPADSFLPSSMRQFRPCPKGYSMARNIYDPARVIYPMKRIGRRGEGKFARISWDEALDTIARKLVEVKQKYGPYSIIHQPYSYMSFCSFPLAPWFGAGIAGWDAHSDCGFHEPQNWVYGKDLMEGYLRYGQFELAQDEPNIFKSKLIVLWGFNPMATHASTTYHNLVQARERGIPIVCIESRYTPSVEVLADQWVPIRPTTDVAMMIAMANVWFKEGLCDQKFVDKWVDPVGLEKWKSYVLGVSDGVDKTPTWAETICGVPAETIASFARLYAASKPVNLNVGLSIGRQFYGENAARASMYLQALTGNTIIPGGTAAAETGLWLGRSDGPMPHVKWQQKPGTYRPPVLLAHYKWLKAIDLTTKLDSGEIAKEQYNNLIGNAADNPAPNIQFVILESNNHLQNLPGMSEGIRAMKKTEFNLVFSQYPDMPSALYADILLPQIYSAFEGRNGGPAWHWPLFTTTINLPTHFVYRQKCVDAPGEVKSNDWVWTQIAKRLGIVEQFNPRMASVADKDWDDAVEAIYQEAYEQWAVSEPIAPLNPPTWDEFQKKPVFRFPLEGEPYHAFKYEVDAGRNPFRGTASGKIEFFSNALARGAEYLQKHDIPAGSGKCYGGGRLPAMAEMTKGGTGTFFGKNADKYPLLLSSPHSYYRMHSFLDNNPWLKDECYRHAVWMSVADAKSRGIKDNDLVRVFNDVAEMVIPAYVTSKIVPGSVAIHHGGWYVPGKDKTALMPDGIDMRGSPNLLIENIDLPDTLVGCFPCKALVQIEKWEGQ
ncbi:MAG: molybdopterin-dependent oxidoreductase [Terriglobales bacterium]